MRLFAAPYKGIGKQARVAIAVEFGVDGLGLVERSGRLVGNLALALRPTTSEGKLLEGQRHELALAFKPQTYAQAKSRGVRVLTEMALPPGRYQLRAAGGPTVGRAGSVTYDLEIPDYSKDPLALSGIALTSSTAKDSVTIWPGTARPLDGLLPAPITAAREFGRDETVTVYAEVYENGKRAAHAIDVTLDLRSDTGRVLSTVTATRSSTERNTTGSYGFVAPIAMTNVTPGSYVLHLEATRDHSAKSTLAKDIPIRVR
jgi:hypothetical protein